MQRMPSAFAFAVNCVRARRRQREREKEKGDVARREKKTTCSRIALLLLEHLRGGKGDDGGRLAGATL